MKIAFLVNQFPKLSETFILSQITGLIDRGHSIKIFARSRGQDYLMHPSINRYNLLNMVVYLNELPSNSKVKIVKLIHSSSRDNVFRKALYLLKFIKNYKVYETLNPLFQGNFDIIHCHFGPNGILASFLKDIGFNSKIITTFHGYDLSAFIRQFGPESYKNLFKKGDLFLPISNYFKEELIALGCDANKIIVHHMGIDLNKFKFITREPPREKVKILTVGRLVEKKGHEYALLALKRILRNFKNIEYIIAGDGPLKDKLQKITHQLDISKYVRFVGSVNQNEVVNLYYSSHIFLLPSITAQNGDREGIPVVLMEAQATGMPVISTVHSGIPELVVDGKSGFLVPEKDVNLLAERLSYLLTHYDIWPEMGAYGRQIIEKEYNIDFLNIRLEKIFKNLLSKEHGRE